MTITYPQDQSIRNEGPTDAPREEPFVPVYARTRSATGRKGGVKSWMILAPVGVLIETRGGATIEVTPEPVVRAAPAPAHARRAEPAPVRRSTPAPAAAPATREAPAELTGPQPYTSSLNTTPPTAGPETAAPTAAPPPVIVIQPQS